MDKTKSKTQTPTPNKDKSIKVPCIGCINPTNSILYNTYICHGCIKVFINTWRDMIEKNFQLFISKNLKNILKEIRNFISQRQPCLQKLPISPEKNYCPPQIKCRWCKFRLILPHLDHIPQIRFRSEKRLQLVSFYAYRREIVSTIHRALNQVQNTAQTQVFNEQSASSQPQNLRLPKPNLPRNGPNNNFQQQLNHQHINNYSQITHNLENPQKQQSIPNTYKNTNKIIENQPNQRHSTISVSEYADKAYSNSRAFSTADRPCFIKNYSSPVLPDQLFDKNTKTSNIQGHGKKRPVRHISGDTGDQQDFSKINNFSQNNETLNNNIIQNDHSSAKYICPENQISNQISKSKLNSNSINKSQQGQLQPDLSSDNNLFTMLLDIRSNIVETDSKNVNETLVEDCLKGSFYRPEETFLPPVEEPRNSRTQPPIFEMPIANIFRQNSSQEKENPENDLKIHIDSEDEEILGLDETTLLGNSIKPTTSVYQPEIDMFDKYNYGGKTLSPEITSIKFEEKVVENYLFEQNLKERARNERRERKRRQKTSQQTFASRAESSQSRATRTANHFQKFLNAHKVDYILGDIKNITLPPNAMLQMQSVFYHLHEDDINNADYLHNMFKVDFKNKLTKSELLNDSIECVPISNSPDLNNEFDLKLFSNMVLSQDPKVQASLSVLMERKMRENKMNQQHLRSASSMQVQNSAPSDSELYKIPDPVRSGKSFMADKMCMVRETEVISRKLWRVQYAMFDMLRGMDFLSIVGTFFLHKKNFCPTSKKIQNSFSHSPNY